MRKILVLFCLTLVVTSVFPQLKTTNLPPKTYYREAKITTADFNSLTALNLKINTDSLYFLSMQDQAYQSLALKNIKYLRVHEGNYFTTGAFWGGLALTVIGAVSTYQKSEPHSLEDGRRILKFTLGGALGGGLIGLSFPKWKTYIFDN
ncbi:hypothetical protein [Saccharicrinis sp. FJH54]|uniref:hypothetical protein n=1 Tax=Saccharicrinis sp. FJH54 TaxID=3344665 RepID=UPI0035D5038B